MAKMEDIIILIRQGEELPKVGKKFELISEITKTTKTIKVKKIVDLKWNHKGDLIVGVKGNIVGIK